MRSLLVVDVVGLTPTLLGPETPALCRLAEEGFQAALRPVLPALTCSAQASLLTGGAPRDHGIVANGWYFRDLAEVHFWRQSNHLVGGEKVWETARRRDASFRCAKLFWWFNMYSSAEISVTPRPIYPADGRKIPSIYTHPPDIKPWLEGEIGPFPFFQFWGPAAGLPSSEWIASAARCILQRERPTLTLVYLPHLDYDLQRHGPQGKGIREEVRAVDRVAGGLIEVARALDIEVIVLSEYGITEVRGSVPLNAALRGEGLVAVRDELGREQLDPGASRAFAVCDHQVAHVYVRDRDDIRSVKLLLEGVEGVDLVLDEDGKREHGLDHPRSGELVAVSTVDRWFDYTFWLDEARAPDFARTVDIHRKPGYDPLELFVDPKLCCPKIQIAAKLLRKKLGFRGLLDVIPLDTSLVRGSHGRLPERPEDGPVLISSSTVGKTTELDMTAVRDLILETVF